MIYHHPLTRKIIRHDFESFLEATFHTLHPGQEYLPNWHISLLAEYLQACERGDIRRLIITLPPRMMKSISVSVAWPAWLLGHNPAKKILAASYTQALANKHSLDCRAVMRSEWYQRNFPHAVLAAGMNQQQKFHTTQHGFRMAVSVGGMVTGEGGDVLIMDDPHNPSIIHRAGERQRVMDWFQHSFATRLNHKNKGVMVLVMQRLHADDLVGMLTKKQPRRWQHLQLPAIVEAPVIYDFGRIQKQRAAGEALHPTREDAETLLQIQAELGAETYAAQYLQAPLLAVSSFIKIGHVRRYHGQPLAIKRVIQSWDTAIKTGEMHDYSVCTTWAEAQHPETDEAGYFLLHVLRGKFSFTALRQQIETVAEQFSPEAILVEDKASGQSVIQVLKQSTCLPVMGIMPQKNKEQRVLKILPLFEAGKIFLPYSAEWLPAFEQELLAFPDVNHDDQIDSVSQALLWLSSRGKTAMNIRRL